MPEASTPRTKVVCTPHRRRLLGAGIYSVKGLIADPRDLRLPGCTVGLAGAGQQSSEVLGVQNSMARDVHGIPGGAGRRHRTQIG